MQNYEAWTVKDGLLEFLNDSHTYIYEGKVLPSITQILGVRFGNKYKGVSKKTLNEAAKKGTAVHEAIEHYEKQGVESDLVELKNWKFLKNQYKFNCIDNEVPVVLFLDDRPVAAGRLDLVLEKDGEIGLADIKRTSVFDKEYVAYQLNLYMIAYEYCYDQKIDFLKGVHLREEKRRYIDIPVTNELALDLVKEYMKGKLI